MPSTCLSDDERYLALISARDQVFLYGSQDAIDLANSFVLQIRDIVRQYERLEQLARDECSGETGPGLSGARGMGAECLQRSNEADKFKAATDFAFLSEIPNKFPLVVCRELNAVPRASCVSS